MKESLVRSTLVLVTVVVVAAGGAWSDPLPGETLKFFQTPLNNGAVVLPPGATLPTGSVPAPWPGHDELSTALTNGNSYVGTYMADDFCDLESTPIVHVMWWGSYINNYIGNGVQQFLITFESDVSAGDPNNPFGFSHPGTNIVSQIVALGPLAPGSGTFTEVPVPIGNGPANPDGNLYQYNAELAVPVPEVSNQVMWIKIVALTTDPQLRWGWHDRDYGVQDPFACTPPAVVPGESNMNPAGGPPNWHFQDDAITGTLAISPQTNVTQQADYTPTFYLPAYDGTNTSKDLAFALYTTSCPQTATNPPTKWIQPPDLQFGMNVYDVSPKILADDFLCTTNGPITDIHFWGSWLSDQVSIITNVHISFHEDIPAGGTTPYSRPGLELWSTNFAYGQFTESFYTNSDEYFFDPNIGQIIGGDTMVFRYDFLVDADKAFVQTNGKIYWLDVQVKTLDGVFGWKSASTHCYDDAAWSDTPTLSWQELRYPPGHPLVGQSFDLAFELTTTPGCPPPPTNPPTKWIEYPDLVNGMNVLDTAPKVLGDDFLCTLTGPITDIHIWGSWLNDQVGIIKNMHIDLYSDVPATNNTYSHPGNPLWSTNFLDGQFTFRLYTNSVEQFFNPNVNEIIGGDSLVFRYNFCIDPEKALIQTNGTIYWLVAQAETESGTFGWKSSGTHCYDDAVWGDTPSPIFWQELRYPPGHPLAGQSFDLAFEITTLVPFDLWQLQYFGCTNCPQAAAGADPDGDGASNTNEFAAGTVPTNSASYFHVTSIARTGAGSNDVTLTWAAVGGHSYVVQTNSPPVSGDYTNNFSDLSLDIPAPGVGEFSLSYTDGGGATNKPTRYYRVRLGPPLCQ